MRCQYLLDQGGARPWHADDEDWHHRRVAEAASLAQCVGGEYFPHPLKLRQCRDFVIDDLFSLERVALDKVRERPVVLWPGPRHLQFVPQPNRHCAARPRRPRRCWRGDPRRFLAVKNSDISQARSRQRSRIGQQRPNTVRFRRKPTFIRTRSLRELTPRAARSPAFFKFFQENR